MGDPAYRFMLVFEWGKTKVITVRRVGSRWMLEAAQFKHPRVAPFAVDKRVSRRLTLEEVGTLDQSLDRDGFWRLRKDEPDRGCCYDGPNWIMEGRSLAGYQIVERAWDRNDFIRTARLFMLLAGMQGESNSAPPTHSLAYSMNATGHPGTIVFVNSNLFTWTSVEVEIGDSNAPFVCPATHRVSPDRQLRVVLGDCRDSSGRPATEASVVRVSADQGAITSAIEPGLSAR
jgi:hypothetical protein